MNSMKHNASLFFALTLLLCLTACEKDEIDQTPDAPVEICGIDGMRMKADVDDAAICFSATLVANLADGQLTIGGINPTSGSLALQLDETSVGTHVATGDMNQVFFTIGTVAYQSTNEAPGTINITSHDQSANRIKGLFTAQLASPDGSPAKSVSGTFEVLYLEQ